MTMNETEYSRKNVGELFDEISPRYDFVNRLLSFGMDIYWRKRLARQIKPCKSLLDLASGTCDQIHFMKPGTFQKATALDISEGMLKFGREKLKNRDNITFMNASALNVPLNKKTQDVITMSFGIRNVMDPLKCLKEMHRLLKPGGKTFILEFSMPKWRWFRAVYLVYLRHILPKVGRLISKNNSAYTYLNQTIETFAHGEAFLKWMRESGFKQATYTPMTFGIVTLYVGTKDEATRP